VALKRKEVMRMRKLLRGKKDIWRFEKKEGKLKYGDMRRWEEQLYPNV
jgi:hypothetical protein